jgi:glutaredoxin
MNACVRGFLLVLVLAAVGPTSADMYKWVDTGGVVHFSDRPPAVDSPGGTVEVIETPEYSAGPPPSAPAEPPRAYPVVEPAPAVSASPAATAHPVELYTTSWCTYCRKAKAFFQARGIPFVEYDIERDPEAARRKAMLDGRRGVPFAVVNGRRIHGYSEKAYLAALEGR